MGTYKVIRISQTLSNTFLICFVVLWPQESGCKWLTCSFNSWLKMQSIPCIQSPINFFEELKITAHRGWPEMKYIQDCIHASQKKVL
jgi:hypothetical protein